MTGEDLAVGLSTGLGADCGVVLLNFYDKLQPASREACGHGLYSLQGVDSLFSHQGREVAAWQAEEISVGQEASGYVGPKQRLPSERHCAFCFVQGGATGTEDGVCNRALQGGQEPNLAFVGVV